MFFGKKICPKCQSEYDVAMPTCPACGEADPNYPDGKLSKEATWMVWWRQLVIFVIGSIGLTIAGTLAAIPFIAVRGAENGLTLSDTLWVDFIGYTAILIGMFIVAWPRRKDLVKSFRKWLPFVIGLAGAAALYFFSLFYGVILQLIRKEVTDNANQSLAVLLVKGYPVVSFFLLGIMGPVAEELTYRVGLFSFCLRAKKWVAYVVVTIVFALIHFDFESFGNTKLLINELLNLPSYAFAGCALCFLYDRWGLSASLTAHILNNIVSCIFILL